MRPLEPQKKSSRDLMKPKSQAYNFWLCVSLCYVFTICSWLSVFSTHSGLSQPIDHYTPANEVGVCYIAHVFFYWVPYMERMCSLHSKDDWVQLNCPVLICVQSNQLKSSWPRWTHFTIKHTEELVDTAAQLSYTDAAEELCWFECFFSGQNWRKVFSIPNWKIILSWATFQLMCNIENHCIALLLFLPSLQSCSTGCWLFYNTANQTQASISKV